MGSYEPKVGDRVRVVLEGEVTYVNAGGTFTLAECNYIAPYLEHVVSVEEVEPPVVTFKPGDTVRWKHHSNHLYSVGVGGYYSHTSGNWIPFPNDDAQVFTSDTYELVEID